MKYFTIAELTASATAAERGIDNTPASSVKANLTALVDNVLDPLREAYGHPIRVTSGYRCRELNSAVGGVSNSQHLTGEAADITAGNVAANGRLWQLIKSFDLPVDQVIDERGLRWIHVSYSTHRCRRQFLRM